MEHSKTLAKFIAELKFEDLPPQAVDRAKVHILDTLGVCLGASSADHLGPALETVIALGGNEDCTLIGHAFRSHAVDAAFINGLMAHSIDFDDGHRFVHPGSAVVPTALAFAEYQHLSGQALIRSVVAGYEVSVRSSLAAGLEHRTRGYHPTGTCNSLGAAAATAVALNLENSALHAALGIAASQAGGVSQYRFDGSPIKHLHAGLASRAGATSGLLAMNGFRGTAQPLEGQFGFLNVMAGGGDPAELTAELGRRPFAVENTDIKPYPSCRQTHASIDLALAAVREHGIDAEAVQEILVEIYEYAYKDWLISTRPCESALQAMLNIPYCVAVAIAHGKVRLDSFSQAARKDARVHRLAEQVTIRPADDLTRAWPEQRGVRMTIRTADQLIRLSAVNPLGGQEAPLDFAAVAEKFRGLAGTVVGGERTERVIAMVEQLDRLADVSDLAVALALPDYEATSRKERIQR